MDTTTKNDSDKIQFGDIYKGYVIKEEETQMYIGENSDMYRVFLREQAARFTKKEAIEYLQSGCFIEKGKTYWIEDACQLQGE